MSRGAFFFGAWGMKAGIVAAIGRLNDMRNFTGGILLTPTYFVFDLYKVHKMLLFCRFIFPVLIMFEAINGLQREIHRLRLILRE